MSTAATVVSFEPSAFVPLALGFAHIAVGAWLMYLTVAAALNFARGFNLPL